MKTNRYLITLLIIALVFTGCKKQENKSEYKPKDMAPSNLAEVSKGIDDILLSIGEIERLNLNIPPKNEKLMEVKVDKKEEQGADSKNEDTVDESQKESPTNQEGSQGSQNSDSSGGGEQTDDKKESKAEKEKKEWDKIEQKLEGIHPKWNAFEVEGQKKGATKENSEKFESAINKLTKSVEDKNIAEVYYYTGQSFLNLKPFYDLYLDEIGGDIAMLKYVAYSAYLKAIQDKTDEAAELLSGREENINRIKLKLTKEEDQIKVERLALSIIGFKDALIENSRILYIIKRDVIIESIKDL